MGNLSYAIEYRWLRLKRLFFKENFINLSDEVSPSSMNRALRFSKLDKQTN